MATPEETAQRMLTAFQKLNDRTIELQREIEVLTLERDNALLRIEELEAQVDATPTDWGRYGGGVHPNA